MNTPNTFWSWFTDHNESLTMLNDLSEAESQTLLDDLQQQLDAYCPGLTYEMGEPTQNGRRLTFSAEGDLDLFRYVSDLVEQAPDLDWWEFEAFRQPQGKALKVAFDKYRFDTSQMYFMQLECEDAPDAIGLRVALPKAMMAGTAPDDDDLLVGVYVTIEALVGEFDCATLIGYFDVCPLPAEPFKEGFRPLDDLPDFVEWFKSR